MSKNLENKEMSELARFGWGSLFVVTVAYNFWWLLVTVVTYLTVTIVGGTLIYLLTNKNNK